jgi:tetratricopeptide (TPR) repeat protein
MTKPGVSKYFFLLLFLLLLIAISYSNTLYSPFILDDFSAFIRNPNMYLEDFSLNSLAKLFHTRFGKRRLIPIFTFALDHYFGKGSSMVPYHVTNTVIHLLATVSLFFFINGLLQTKGAKNGLKFFHQGYFALAVCALWALSPLQTNAVTYLVQRMTSIASLFYFAACAFYIYARLKKQFWQRIIFTVWFLMAALCAFFSKENSATLPLAILFIEFMFVSPGLFKRLIKASRWYHWLIIAVIIILVFPPIQHKWNNLTGGFSGRHFTLSERLFTQLRIVVFYISILFLPLPGRMNLDHDFSLSKSLVAPPATLLSLLLLTGLLVTAFHVRKKYPLIAFGIFWFYLNLILESSFIPLELIFEHRLYLPSAGFFLAVIAIIDLLLGKYAKDRHPEIKKIVFLIFIVIISGSSILTSLRNNDWRDRVALYRNSYEKSPQKSRAASNYAMALGRAENYDECVKYGLIANSLGQQGYEDYINSATNTLSCLLMQEKYEEAIEKGESIHNKILQKNLKFISAGALEKYMFNRGRAYTEVGEYQKALENFQISLFRNPSQAENFLAINRLILLAQQEEEGRKTFKIGEEKYEIPLYLAKVAMKYRQYERAALYLQDAQKLGADQEDIVQLGKKLQDIFAKNRLKAKESNINKNQTYAQNQLFRSYLKAASFIMNKYWPLENKLVGWLLRQAQKIDPDNPFLPVYWAKWHMKNGRIDAAIAILETNLNKNENFIPVLELLGLCYQNKKDYPQSVEYFKKILDLNPGNANWNNYLAYIYKYEDKVNESKRSPLDYQ